MRTVVGNGATALIALALASCGGAGNPQSAATGSAGSAGVGTSGGTDYSVMAHWVCRPGAESVCTDGLGAEVQNADGSTAAQPFTRPPIR